MRDILGFEGLYAVTEEGRVFSYRSNKFLKPINNGNGYMIVNLRDRGRYLKKYVHRLTIAAFKEESDLQVNHINGIKTDNNLRNLEYCTSKHNNQHALATGLRDPRKKIKDRELEIIKCLSSFGWTQRSIARVLEVSKVAVGYHLRKGER